jgi:hypothetical protein
VAKAQRHVALAASWRQLKILKAMAQSGKLAASGLKAAIVKAEKLKAVNIERENS